MKTQKKKKIISINKFIYNSRFRFIWCSLEWRKNKKKKSFFSKMRRERYLGIIWVTSRRRDEESNSKEI